MQNAPTGVETASSARPASSGHTREDAADLATEVAIVLAGMTYEERVRAYRSGALSAHELSVAAAWFPEHMPLLNGEYEWIACTLADNE
jgi:hypothetical protein